MGKIRQFTLAGKEYADRMQPKSVVKIVWCNENEI